VCRPVPANTLRAGILLFGAVVLDLPYSLLSTFSYRDRFLSFAGAVLSKGVLGKGFTFTQWLRGWPVPRRLSKIGGMAHPGDPRLSGMMHRLVPGLAVGLATGLATGLALSLVVLFNGGTGQAAEQTLTRLDAPLAACAPHFQDAADVTHDAGDNLFRSADGTRFLASDLRFSGPKAPQPASRATPAGQEPVELAALPLGPPNRWGLVPAWIVASRTSGAYLWQARRLEEGVAVFAPEHGTAACADALRAAEGRARRAGAGIWQPDSAGPIYSSDLPKSFKDAGGRYVIVRGRIVSLGKTRRTRYLNFGKYWKTDLTGTVKTTDEEVFNTALSADGWTLDTLAGQFVELRGIVEHRDGPHIALRFPEQLVVLEDKRAGRDGQGNN